MVTLRREEAKDDDQESSMRVALIAATLFATAFVVHLIVWRVRLPRRHTASLLVILLGSLPVGLTAGWVLSRAGMVQPLGAWEVLHVAIFHVSVSLAYIVAYSAIEERSPSMTMLTRVADAKGAGCTRDELARALRGAVTVEARIGAMTRDRMIEEVDGFTVITPKGLAWNRVFSAWRRLARLEKGG